MIFPHLGNLFFLYFCCLAQFRDSALAVIHKCLRDMVILAWTEFSPRQLLLRCREVGKGR